MTYRIGKTKVHSVCSWIWHLFFCGTIHVDLSQYSQELSWIWVSFLLLLSSLYYRLQILSAVELLGFGEGDRVLKGFSHCFCSSLSFQTAHNLALPPIVECCCGGILCCPVPVSFFGRPTQLGLGGEAFSICLHILPVALVLCRSFLPFPKWQFFLLSSRNFYSFLKCNQSLPLPCRQEGLPPLPTMIEGFCLNGEKKTGK